MLILFCFLYYLFNIKPYITGSYKTTENDCKKSYDCVCIENSCICKFKRYSIENKITCKKNMLKEQQIN